MAQGRCAARVGMWCRRGALHLERIPPWTTCAAGRARGNGLAAMQGGTCRLLNRSEFHQVFNLAVEVPLRQVLRLWQCLQKDRCRGYVLAHVELLRELHAGVVDDVVADPECAPTRGTHGVYPL